MNQNTVSLPDPGKRVGSLDALRGFIMFSMLLHTFGLEKLKDFPVVGFIFNQLNHVPWVGFHFEDLILPSFLFIMGVSLGLSDEKRRARGEPYRARFNHALERAVILFCLGFILTWIGAKKPTLGPGVLQVLAMCYFGGFLCLARNIKTQFAVFGALLFIYWLFIFIIPVPEAGRNSYEVFKNLVYLIDNRLTGSTSRWGYLYPTITSVAVVVYGSIVSRLLLNRTSHTQFIKMLAVLGTIGVLSGLALHPVIPIIKRMFTSSYTLFTCGLVTFLLILFYWLIDVRGYTKWSFPFMVFGMNSIFVYMLNGLFDPWLLDTSGIFIEPFAVLIGVWVVPLEHTARLTAEWLVCFWLYRRKIFIKL